MIVTKVPSLTCEKCGGFRVMMTNNGPECEECDTQPLSKLEITEEVEYFIEQLRNEELDINETF
jgi:hypothetical protein